MNVLSQLMGFLGMRNAVNSGKAGPLTLQVIHRQIEASLERQRSDAQAKDADPSHWCATGSVVRRALHDCEQILLPLPQAAEVETYFNKILPLLAMLAQQYRQDPSDPDGFGLGTVREIEETAKSIAQNVQNYPRMQE